MKYALLFAAGLVIVPTTASAQQAPAPAPVVVQAPGAPPAPVYVQPAPVYPAPPAYGQPPYGQPAYGQPVYGQPQGVYVQPTYATPRRRMVMEYNGGPIPPGAALRTRRMLGAAIPGAAVFGLTWIINVFAALIAGSCGTAPGCPNTATQWLYLPVAGPWVMLTQNVGSSDRPILILDGILQGAGFLAMVLGIAITHQDLIYYANGEPPRRRASRPMWSVLPLAPGAQMGMTLSVMNF